MGSDSADSSAPVSSTNAPANQSAANASQNSAPPQVDAGPARAEFEATEITLVGEAFPAPNRSIRQVFWRQSNTDEIRAVLPGDTSESTLVFTLPQVERDTTLTFVFTAEDNTGERTSDSVAVLVRDRLPNKRPIAKIVAPASVSAGTASVSLDACSSTDPDGAVTAYAWFERINGADRALSETTCQLTAALNRQSPQGQRYEFIVRVTDNAGATDEDNTTVQQGGRSGNAANSAPVVQSTTATPTPARPGEEISLTALANDADGDSLSYLWEQTAGQQVIIFEPKQANTRFLAPDQKGSVSFRLTVSDGLAQNSQVLTVAIEPTAASNQPSLTQCLITPQRAGCFTGAQNLLTDNQVASLINFSASTDSAGVCNPLAVPSWAHYYGALHEHTAFSDGTLLTTPASVMQRVRSKGFNFAFTTDHSDNMGLPAPLPDPNFCQVDPLACVLADPTNPQSNLDKWGTTLAMANRNSTPQFTAIRGFEWTSDRFGHANVLFSSNYINAKTGPGYAVNMDAFWQWFTLPANVGGGNDGLMVFNHPGREDSLHGPLLQATNFFAQGSAVAPGNPTSSQLPQGDPAYAFNDFAYRGTADYRVVGVEVFGKGDEYDSDGKKGSWLAHALDKGWFLAPTGSEDHHDTRWGDADLPKTVIIARTNSANDLKQAMMARRMYAVAQNYNNVRLEFKTLDGTEQPMGSRIRTQQSVLNFRVAVGTRPGTATQLAVADVAIEVLGSQGNNAVRYTPLLTPTAVAGAPGQFEFSVPVAAARNWVFVRVRDKRNNNRIAAVSAPIWFEKGMTPLFMCAER